MQIKSVLAVSLLSSSMLSGVCVANTHHHHHPHHHHKHPKHHKPSHPAQHEEQRSFSHVRSHHFLVGGEMGYSRQKEKFIMQATPSDRREETISDKGTTLGLLAGWQYLWHRTLLGIEASVDFQNHNQPRPFLFSNPTTGTLYSGTAYYKRGPIWALTTRAGYFVTPGFMPYFRVGAQVSEDEANSQLYTTNAAGVVTTRFNSHEKNIYGVVGGIGVEFPTFIGGSTLRVEYDFTRTESLPIDVPSSVLTDKFYHADTNALKVAWVWNFI